MDRDLIMIILLGISLLTSLTTEAVKKILNEMKIKYSSNILAAIVAVVITTIASVLFVIYTGEVVTAKLVVEIIALVFMSFLISTVGYDKVVQAITQIKKG